MPASALVRRVVLGLLVANLAVVGAKLAVGLASGSLAVLGSAVDSAVDALNNVLALIVVRVAAKAPDEDHPYGHGKFETLGDRKSTRLNSSHLVISYAVFCLKKKKTTGRRLPRRI